VNQQARTGSTERDARFGQMRAGGASAMDYQGGGQGMPGEHMRTKKSGYVKLFIALGISLLVMYLLTMAFVNEWDHYYLNLSNFYMAVLMVAPMGLIMLYVMRDMFPDRRLNMTLVVGFVALFALSFWLGRTQAFVGNDQFLRAMIPHHSRAIQVCENASITDPEIEQLCQQIVEAQREEITIMERMLRD
jgi:hypothetical protein